MSDPPSISTTQVDQAAPILRAVDHTLASCCSALVHRRRATALPGAAGIGRTEKELKRLAGVFTPLQVPKMPLAEPPQLAITDLALTDADGGA